MARKRPKNRLSKYAYSKLKKRLIEKRGVWCQECGQSYSPEMAVHALDIHHLKHRSQGGGDDEANLVLLCRTCHDKRHFQPVGKK